jgi:hypothetical protein
LTGLALLPKRAALNLGENNLRLALRYVSAIFATILMLLTAHAAVAGKQDITIINKTGGTIQQLFISAANTKDWEEDVLGRDELDPDDEFELEFTKAEKACKWDMKVVYSDGDESEWYGLDLCKISRVELYWDKKRKQTRAVVQ